MSFQTEWVSLKEASARAGVSISWLRKQYREHGLPTRDTTGPRGLQKAVPIDEVMARAAVFAPSAPPASGPEPVSPTGPTPVSAPVTLADLAALVERLTRHEHECPLLERLIEVEARAARAEAEAAYLLLRLDDAYLEIDQLRSQFVEGGG